MPTASYGRFAHTIDRMIYKYGYNEKNPGGRLYLRRSGVDRECRGGEIDFNPREVDGVIIQRTDRRFVISAKTANGPLTPAPDDEHDTLIIKDGGVEDTIETELIFASRPKRLAPAGVILFWELHVRSR